MSNVVQKISVDVIDDPVIAMRTDIDDAYIDDLSRSIKEHGLINPISIKQVGERYEVIAGHQRLLAARRAGIILLDCIVRDISSEESLVLTAHENMVRQDVNPVDEAVFLARLATEKEYSVEQISKMLRRSVEWVSGRLGMLAYPQNVLTFLATKRISMGAAAHLMKITDVPYRDNLFEIAAKDGITTDTADRWFNMWKLNLLPTAPTSETLAAVTSENAPPETALQCAKCQQAGLIRSMMTVWIHRECPHDES